jgi:hypothetical protein
VCPSIGTRRPAVIVITAAMLHPVGLGPFAAARRHRLVAVVEDNGRSGGLR